MKAKSVVLPHDAAGHKMTSKVPTVLSTDKISDVRKLIQEDVNRFESINYVYVISKSKKLKGVLSIKDIFRLDPKTAVAKAMITKIVRAHPKSDQEKVAHMALANNIKAVPLVDQSDVFAGVLTSDTILSILDQESRDDLLKLSGIIMGKRRIDLDDFGVAHAYAARIPWILIGLFGGLITAKIIGSFEQILSQNIILASFIPLVAYIANAVGTQTQTLYIRDLATRPKFSFLAYSTKQAIISVLIGLSVWITLVFITTLTWGMSSLGMIVGFSLFLAILVASFFALVIPRVLDQFNIDPANGSGPFATIIQDLLSVVIYLSVANLFI